MTFCDNDFPLDAVQPVIRNRITVFNKIKQASVPRCPVYYHLHWLGGISDRFAMQISQIVQDCYFSANVWVVFNTKPIWIFICKDFLPPHHNNFLIYLFKCICGLQYKEETNQRLNARIKQHVPTKIQNFNIGPIDNLKNTYRSSIAEYQIKYHDCAEKFSINLFSVLSKPLSSFHFTVLEIIYILSSRPSYNFFSIFPIFGYFFCSIPYYSRFISFVWKAKLVCELVNFFFLLFMLWMRNKTLIYLLLIYIYTL